MSYHAAILIISDRVSRGEREDGCMPAFRAAFSNTEFEIVCDRVCSDNPSEIRTSLQELLAEKPQLIFTSGGTGCSNRDNTPEITSAIIERPTPGIDEAIRRFSAEKVALAIYSRAVSGYAGDTLIINLPGSPKAVNEIVEFLLPTLAHPLRLRAGNISDCADEQSR